MFWNEKCLLELTHHNLFESTANRDRFRELLDCYWTAPFFNKGICKCMYLASWDDIHFAEILSVLNELTIQGTRSVQLMKEQGEDLVSEAEGFSAEAYRLSLAFLTNSYYQLPDFSSLDPDEAHIIRQSLLAAQYIDELPDPHSR